MDEDGPTITTLLLGDPSCGKSTFLSRLSLGPANLSKPLTPHNTLPSLRDYDQPFIYNIRMYHRSYRFEFYDTASPENYTLLQPDFVILCYDINDRRSLNNVRDVWSERTARLWLSRREEIPVMLLGLKRDLRVQKAGAIYPQEGHKIAQELRCDIYAECSATTGELMEEVFEDIARKAAKTTTPNGGLTQGGCNIM